ncbi:hypothetical protein WDW89_25015 [Deltaproteobacteria bacterium TL4]
MKKYDEIIQCAWDDESFRNKFVSDPKSVFSEMGQSVDENITLEVHCDTANSMNFVLMDRGMRSALNLDESSIGQVTKRAFDDESYRLRLLGDDPKAAIKDVLGVEPPCNISIHENTPQRIHLVLPANPEITGELSDSDLAMVAGGKTGQEWNQKVCHGMEKLFLKGEEKLGAGTMGGFLGTLSVLAGPLMTGGVAFSRAASAME